MFLDVRHSRWGDWDCSSTVKSFHHHKPDCSQQSLTATPDASENEDNVGGRNTNRYTADDDDVINLAPGDASPFATPLI